MVSGAIDLYQPSTDTDQHVEICLTRDVAKLVVGITEFVQEGDYMMFAYGSRTADLIKKTEIWISQPCIEREDNNLTKEQMIKHAPATRTQLRASG